MVFEDIYPSIAGVELPDIGRIDELVAAEQRFRHGKRRFLSRLQSVRRVSAAEPGSRAERDCNVSSPNQSVGEKIQMIILNQSNVTFDYVLPDQSTQSGEQNSNVVQTEVLSSSVSKGAYKFAF